MRILFAYPYVPYPLTCGAYQRAFHLLKEIGRRHEVFLFALSHSRKDREFLAIFRDLCAEILWGDFSHPPWARLASRILSGVPSTVSHWYHEEAKKALDDFLKGLPVDVIHIEDLVMVQYINKGNTPRPFVLDRTRVDLSYQFRARQIKPCSFPQSVSQLENLFKLYLYERRVSKVVNHYVVCCEQDARFIGRVINRSTPITIIPNGVNTGFFNGWPEQISQQNDAVLTFTGSMDYLPNIDGISWFFEHIYPLVIKVIPHLKVFIVGGNPSPAVQRFSILPGVTVTGLVPDVRPYYSRCTAFIAPIRLGGGSRLKIVEAMAMGRPVVSTTVGCEGLRVTDGEDILLADDASTFAKNVLTLLADDMLRQRVGVRGKRLVEQSYSWESLADKLADVYQDVVMQNTTLPGESRWIFHPRAAWRS